MSGVTPAATMHRAVTLMRDHRADDNFILAVADWLEFSASYAELLDQTGITAGLIDYPLAVARVYLEWDGQK
jgi:hypothetical protein